MQTDIKLLETFDLKEQLNKFWEIDTVGIENEPVYEQFKRDILFDGNRYVTSLPFKPYHRALPDNYQLAKHRLKCLKNKLDSNKKLKTEYHKIIKSNFEDQIVERVPTDNDQRSIHYLPHTAVVRNDKETTKVRIVYDASAHLPNKPSLNDCLYKGPCLLGSLYDILLRFRLYPIILVSDIQQAFLNVAVQEKDRDYLRFLWYDDPFSDTPEIEELRLTRVVIGLACSPFLLNGTIQSHSTKYAEK